jgi:hypothetical protein
MHCFLPPPPTLQELRAGLELNFALNSKAFLIEHSPDLVDFVGNRTECALLMLGRKWGGDYKALREQHQPNIAHVSVSGTQGSPVLACHCCSSAVGALIDSSQLALWLAVAASDRTPTALLLWLAAGSSFCGLLCY